MTTGHFQRLFGGRPRRPETLLTQREMDLARSIQEVTGEVMLRMAKHAKALTGFKNLCLAGGVALNCVGNGRILRESGFERIWIQPAAGDAGGALGAALIAWHHYLNRPRRPDESKDSLNGSFLGPSYGQQSIGEYLTQNNIPHIKLFDEEIPDTVADLIAGGKVVGWFKGKMEFGPRALGARSILGDARSPRMQEVMNLKIKFRESFRPFAPSVLKEKASEYFELEHESPYMLFTAPVKKDKRQILTPEEEKLFGIEKLNVVRSTIPAVTHVDYSARVQTVDKDVNPVYYNLIRRFFEKYGCPMIVNTSFNVRGEPLVCRPEEAYACFMRTGMDYLLLENFLLDKKQQKMLNENKDWPKKFALD